MKELGDILGLLLSQKVEFVLVGGYAAVVHGASFITRDIDICVRFSPENLLRLETALRELHPWHRMTPQKLPFVLDPEASTRWKNLYLATDWGAVDCLGAVSGIGDFDVVHARSVEMDFSFGTCRVLDLEALIEAKQAMGRPHDLLTIAQL
jgi:hypothetical protein